MKESIFFDASKKETFASWWCVETQSPVTVKLVSAKTLLLLLSRLERLYLRNFRFKTKIPISLLSHLEISYLQDFNSRKKKQK